MTEEKRMEEKNFGTKVEFKEKLGDKLKRKAETTKPKAKKAAKYLLAAAVGAAACLGIGAAVSRHGDSDESTDNDSNSIGFEDLTHVPDPVFKED